jgi:hypothetical protein
VGGRVGMCGSVEVGWIGEEGAWEGRGGGVEGKRNVDGSFDSVLDSTKPSPEQAPPSSSTMQSILQDMISRTGLVPML